MMHVSTMTSSRAFHCFKHQFRPIKTHCSMKICCLYVIQWLFDAVSHNAPHSMAWMLRHTGPATVRIHVTDRPCRLRHPARCTSSGPIDILPTVFEYARPDFPHFSGSHPHTRAISPTSRDAEARQFNRSLALRTSYLDHFFFTCTLRNQY